MRVWRDLLSVVARALAGVPILSPEKPNQTKPNQGGGGSMVQNSLMLRHLITHFAIFGSAKTV